MKLIQKKENLLDKPGRELTAEMRRTRITRIMRTDHFLGMLVSLRNTLGPVSSWQDVYECFVARVRIGGDVFQNLINGFYGQCWSFRTEESELLWNARTQDGKHFKSDVVMIETTVYDLAQSIWNNAVRSKTDIAGFVRLEAVDYAPKGGEVSQDDVRSALASFPNVMDSLFVKRHQFSDEKELRLIIHVNGKEQNKWLRYSLSNGLLSYSINPTIIKRVFCHPMMSSLRVRQIRSLISPSLQSAIPVEHSKLYELPSSVFNLV